MRSLPILIPHLLATLAFSQQGLINRSALRQDSAFLFIQEENVVEITGYNNAAWKLLAKHAEVRNSDSPWLFQVTPEDSRPDTLQLFRNGKIVLTKTFYCIEAENPRVRLGNITGNWATVPEIIANRRLVVFTPGANILHCTVIDFELVLTADLVPDYCRIRELPPFTLTIK
jgi:hypothetical protein